MLPMFRHCRVIGAAVAPSSWSPEDHAPTLGLQAPEYDDTIGTWYARAGGDFSVTGEFVPLAIDGAPSFDGVDDVLSDNVTLVGDVVSPTAYHVAVNVDMDSIPDASAQLYTDALIVGSIGGSQGLNVFKSGASFYARWFDVDTDYRVVVVEITSVVDAVGAGRFTLQAKKEGGKLWIRLNNGAWVEGDACGATAAGVASETMRIGSSYGGTTVLTGRPLAIYVYPEAKDDTFATNFVSWAANVPTGWLRTSPGNMPSAPDNWESRDGASLVECASGRLLLVGGWNSLGPWPDGASGTMWFTNEVWASDDGGATWFMLLAHDPDPPTSGAAARFLPHHSCPTVRLGSYLYQVGCDSNIGRSGDIWRSADEGETWERITDASPLNDFRKLYGVASYDGKLHVFGGQTDGGNPASVVIDHWSSADGITWTEEATPPWSDGRSASGVCVHNGAIFLVGGGPYGGVDLPRNSVLKYTTAGGWTTVLADGHGQFQGAIYPGLASTGDRLWLLNGYYTDNLYRALYSDDDGVTWTSFKGGSGGGPSHADAVLGTSIGKIVRISGDLSADKIHVIEDFGARVWKRQNRSNMPVDYTPSDGRRIHRLASGRLVMLGGWSPVNAFGGGLHQVTNEVRVSDDEGETWTITGTHVWDATTRFAPQHCSLSGVYQGKVFVIGAEPGSPGGENTDVWMTEDGENWTKVGTTAPTVGLLRAMCGTLGDDIYIMGGDRDGVPCSEVWKSSNGGVSWTQLADAPWSPRGMVYSPVEHNGKLVVVGGAVYDPAVQYNGVWSFDGTTWTEILPDGHAQFVASSFHQVVSLLGRLWILGGYSSSLPGDLNRAVYSDDGGTTWSNFAVGSGLGAAHADAVGVTPTRVLRIAGSSYSDRTVYSFEKTNPAIVPVMLTAMGNVAPSTAGGTQAYLSGTGFTGVIAVAGASEFQVDNDTQILMTFAPHAAGEFEVYLTHPINGRSNSITVTYA